MIAGSSDSGSTPLIMVRSAGGSEREQPKIRVARDSKKRRCARRKIRRAHPESDIVIGSNYFAGVVSGAVGGLVTPREMPDKGLLAAGVTGRGAGAGAAAGSPIGADCVCF